MRYPARVFLPALAVLLGGACCYEDSDDAMVGTAFVVNETHVYLHVFHPDAVTLYLPPGATTSIDVFDPHATFEILIAPGQDTEGVLRLGGLCCRQSGQQDCGFTTVRIDAAGEFVDETEPGQCPDVHGCGFLH